MPSRSKTGSRLLLTRYIAALLVPFLAAAGLILYVWPDQTEQLFAWTINPRMTALLMGAGYLSGLYFFLRVSMAGSWAPASPGFLAVTAFAWFAAAATVLHWDRFNHQHFTFWIWAALYAITPFLVPAIWLINRAAGPDGRPAGFLRLPERFAYPILLSGALVLGTGLLMFILPELLIPVWPWTLTPLTARIVGSFFILAGVSAALIGAGRRWESVRLLLETQLIGLIFLLVGILRGLGVIDLSRPLAWVFIGGISLIFLWVAAAYWSMARRAAEI